MENSDNTQVPNSETKNKNAFFVYEGEILRAASSKLRVSARYLKEGREMFWGNPDQPKRNNITSIVNKLHLLCK